MHQFKHIHLACVLVSLVVILMGRTAVATATQALQCGGWQIVPSPNPSSYFNAFHTVAAASADDVWAVGYGYANGSTLHTLSEHWNGTAWQVAASPTLDSSDLHGITALSADDVWSVGFAGSQTLIEQWNGTQWSMVPSPSVGTYVNILSSVSATSPSDIWTVGYQAVGVYRMVATPSSPTMVSVSTFSENYAKPLTNTELSRTIILSIDKGKFSHFLSGGHSFLVFGHGEK